MLICIADSEYFNIALKAYINEPNSKPLDIKEILCYPFSGQSEMFYTFFATDAGGCHRHIQLEQLNERRRR